MHSLDLDLKLTNMKHINLLFISAVSKSGKKNVTFSMPLLWIVSFVTSGKNVGKCISRVLFRPTREMYFPTFFPLVTRTILSSRLLLWSLIWFVSHCKQSFTTDYIIVYEKFISSILVFLWNQTVLYMFCLVIASWIIYYYEK